jgi:hypothetical protein
VQLTRAALPPLQQDLLQAARLHSPLRRVRGGYVAAPGAKPFTVRTVNALERMGLIARQDDGAQATITAAGSKLLLTGSVEVSDQGEAA